MTPARTKPSQRLDNLLGNLLGVAIKPVRLSPEPLLLDPEGRERAHRAYGGGQIPDELAAAAEFEHPVAVWIEAGVVWHGSAKSRERRVTVPVWLHRE